MTEQLLTPADAGRILGITPAAVVHAAKTGSLEVAQTTVRGHRLFRLADVEAFKRQREERREAVAR